MSKIVSNREKEMIIESIYQSTIGLVKNKGMKGVTVEDIAREAGLAKGSFYKYYPSKEVCLYEVARRSEREMFGRMERVLSESMPNREKIIKVFHEVYLASDSLVPYVAPKDLEVLLRKLPAAYAERDQKKSENYFERSMQLMGIEGAQIQMGVLGHMMDSLAFIASKMDNTSESQEAMELIINTIAEYVISGMNANNSERNM